MSIFDSYHKQEKNKEETMKKRIFINTMVVIVGVFFSTFLYGMSGCESTTSSVLEPVGGAVYYTDASGYADVPFTGIFKPHSAGSVVSLTSIQVDLKDKWWIYHPGSLQIFWRYGTEDEINDHGFELNGPDDNGQYLVTGTMRLPIDNYTVSTKCWPEAGGSYFSNGSDRTSFRVESGMEPQDFVGGTHSFDLPPMGSTVGKCFCMSMFSPFGFTFEYLIPTLMTPQGPGGNGVDVPGWNNLPESVVLLDAVTASPFPEITADFSQGSDEIVLDVHPDGVIDVDLPDPNDWMEYDMSAAGYGIYYICGFEYKIAGGVLQPVTAISTDLELTFENMALKVAESRGGTCAVARASNLLQCVPGAWNTPLDAMPACEVSALYDGRNID